MSIIKQIKYLIKLFLAICLLLVCFSLKSNQQNLPEFEKTHYVDSAGNVYIHEEMPVYLFLSGKSSPGKKVQLSSPSDEHTNPMYMDGHGKHFIIHHDPVTGEQTRHRFFADGIPPESKVEIISGLKMEFDDQFYCADSITVKINAKDEDSGVSKIFYSYNGNNFETYNDPINFYNRQYNELYFFSVDNVGNREDVNRVLFFFNLEDVIDLQDIYFSYDSYYLNQEAREQLDELARTLREYRGVKIELHSHTDARGTSEYNKRLSERRSVSVKNYLISRGVSPQRLVAKGFGDSEILNHCKKDVECTDEEHSINRRTEFIIIPINDQ